MSTGSLPSGAEVRSGPNPRSSSAPSTFHTIRVPSGDQAANNECGATSWRSVPSVAIMYRPPSR